MLDHQFRQAIQSIQGFKKKSSEAKFSDILQEYEGISEAVNDFLEALFISADKSLQQGLDEKYYLLMTEQARLLTSAFQGVKEEIAAIDHKILYGEEEGKDKLPDDYEACGDCGFDHSYESREAQDWHLNNP